MKKYIKKILLLIASVLLVYFFGFYFSNVYIFFGYEPDGFFSIVSNAAFIVFSMVLSYIFFVVFLYTAFAGEKKYWWIGILLVPAVVFELYFAAEYIHIPILIGFIGWILGYGADRMIEKIRKENV